MSNSTPELDLDAVEDEGSGCFGLAAVVALTVLVSLGVAWLGGAWPFA